MKFSVCSDKGKIREINEDSYNVIAGYPGIPVSFIIADGMGGHNSGEIASKMAVDSISSFILQYAERFVNEEVISEAIMEAVKKANEEIYTEAAQHKSNSGMGTTLTVAVINNKKIYIGHVGDSRAFLIRNNEMTLLTTDHTYIEELVKNGSITREEALSHPKKNVLVRAVGCEENINVDIYVYDIQEGDICLLCTDGLTNMLSENELLDIVKSSEDPEYICKELVNNANIRGGEDNITVIVVQA
ncbi:MAG: Stp1/IreP family PP2C-type Ser/Thr phosphatase [Bacillota bacterium]|nr:Stp1/IreP family PP2C-type Ser/Thr phosphatase [Bacillota bacterium]